MVGESQHCCSWSNFGSWHWCIFSCFASICRFFGKFYLISSQNMSLKMKVEGRFVRPLLRVICAENSTLSLIAWMVCSHQSFDHADLRGRDMSNQNLRGVVFAGTWTIRTIPFEMMKLVSWCLYLTANCPVSADFAFGNSGRFKGNSRFRCWIIELSGDLKILFSMWL